MPAKLEIIESPNSVRAKINFAFREQVNKRMRGYAPVISRKVGELIGNKLMETPAAQSILTGQLKADFGLTDVVAQSALSELIAAVKKSTVVKLDIKTTEGVRNAWAMSVSILPDGLVGVLSKIGSYKSGRYEIPWMEWLLTRGVEVVVDGAYVVYWNADRGRSGMATMEKGSGPEDTFRVDPQFAGTADDNFVVNTIKSLLPEIGVIMRSYL
jgi:hypothetical protein